MPLYLVERQFAEQLEMSEEGLRGIEAVNAESGVEWLHSFLSADRRKTYCLYQAADPDAIRRAAERAGIPADKIIEVAKFDPKAPAL